MKINFIELDSYQENDNDIESGEQPFGQRKDKVVQVALIIVLYEYIPRSSNYIVANTNALAHYIRAMEKMIKHTTPMLLKLDLKMFTVAHNQWLNEKSNYLNCW